MKDYSPDRQASADFYDFTIKDLNKSLNDRAFTTIVYNNSPKDIFPVYCDLIFKNNEIYLGNALFSLALTVLAVVSNNTWTAIWIFPVLFLYLLLISAIILALALALGLIIGRKGIFTEHLMMFFEDHFIEQTLVNKTTYLWEQVIKVKDTAQYIYIHCEQQQIHVIPKNIFRSEPEIARFIQFIKSKIKKKK